MPGSGMKPIGLMNKVSKTQEGEISLYAMEPNTLYKYRPTSTYDYICTRNPFRYRNRLQARKSIHSNMDLLYQATESITSFLFRAYLSRRLGRAEFRKSLWSMKYLKQFVHSTLANCLGAVSGSGKSYFSKSFQPTKADYYSATLDQGNMRSPDSAASPDKDKDGFLIMLPPPPLPPVGKSRRAISSDGFSSSHTLICNSKDSRSSSLGNGKGQQRKSTGQMSRSQKTQSTKTSISTDSSTDDKQKEVDNPILRLYELRSRLGKGAYGIVWEAYEKLTGQKVALKKIFDAFRNSTDSQRTYREIMFLREFGHHPNMISLLSVHRATNEQDIYLVFPYMDHDLHKLVKLRPEVLTDPAIRSIIYQVLVALKYLHSAEVIHRDLKPANILMDSNLQVKVADFGLARSLTNSPEDSIANQEMTNPVMTDYVATRWYRPPEILLSCKMYTKGVDMWSIGCILGEMLLKKPLFAGNSTIDQIQTILKSIETPRDEDIQELCNGSGNKIMNPKLVRAGLEEQGDPIEDIFSESDLETVDFLERLLVFNPTRRINVDQAIIHPYVSSVREPQKEWICERLVRPPLSDDVRLKVEDYRQTIYDMVERDQSAMSQVQKFRPHGGVEFLQGISENYYEEIEDIQVNCQEDFQDLEFAVEYENEFREYAKCHQYQTSQDDYQELLIPEQTDNDEIDEFEISTPINEHHTPTTIDNSDRNNNNKEDTPKWANYGAPILMKSISDPTANSIVNNSVYSHQLTPVIERPIKNVSILTLPSENPQSYPKPFTVPMVMPSQVQMYSSSKQGSTTTSTGTGMEDAINNDDTARDSGGIIEKFQTLCQKYELTEDYGPLADYKDKQNFNKAKKAQSCGDYEFLARGDNDKSNNSRKTSPKSWTGGSLTSTKSQLQYQPKLPSLTEHRRDDGDNNNFNNNNYDGDIRKIQDTLTLESSAFVNPYKPKGLKTSDANYGMGDGYEDFEIRNSRSLPSQLGRGSHTQKNDDGFQFIKPPIGFPSNNNSKDSSQYQGFHYKNSNPTNQAKISKSRVEGPKSFHRRQDNPPSHHQSTRLQELFPNKEAIQDRIQEMERRVKAKGVASKESLNSTEGLILINGKNNTCNRNQQRQKQCAEVPKKKFTFNRPGKKEEPQPPIRPFGGRQYDKKFHGPSFRRTPHSFSDPESNQFSHGKGPSSSWKSSDTGGQLSSLRPTADVEMNRKSMTHSAYFPHAGVTHPMSNYKQSQPDRSSKTVKTSNGFSAVHPIPSYNSRGSQGPNQSSLRSKEYRYPTQTPMQPQYPSSVHYDTFEAPAASGSGTIRASDLFELRNNVARERRLGNKNNHKH